MTRGRHRQHLPPLKTVSGAALGTLATAGVVLAVVSGDTQVLRMAVIASWVIALGLVGYSVRRGRALNREISLQESARRREQSTFTEQLTALNEGLARLQAQVERMNSESAELRTEIAQMRVEKAEAEEIVRAARAERARAAAVEREAADQRLLTAAAFEAAAVVLQNFGSGSVLDDADADADSDDWVSAWVASLGAASELDLTMHDETIELELERARVEVVEETPIARIA